MPVIKCFFMKKITLGLIVLFTFQLCTIELNEIDGVIDDHIDADLIDGEAGDKIISIPTESFLSQYFSKNGETPISTRIENQIKHDFDNPLISGFNSDELSAIWIGDFNFEGEEYVFSIKSNKAIKVLIDKEVILNEIENQKETEYKVNHQMDGIHRLIIEYNIKENVSHSADETIDAAKSTDLGASTKIANNSNPIVAVDNSTSTIEFEWTKAAKDPAPEELKNEQGLFRPMGWAANTVGGANGEIIIVNNLNKDGNGSLKAAIEFNKPRIIVFEVGGIIDLKGERLKIGNPFMTIMGQTAPEPGITLIRGGLNIYTHDIIVQHIRVRPGENNQSKKSGWDVDGLSVIGGSNVIIDHCSFSWATDENLSASGQRFEGKDLSEWRKNTSHTITFSNNIVAECLNNSTHANGLHSMGSLIHDNVTEMAIIGNIYASNGDRSPLFKGGANGVIVNNYIYNAKNFAIQYKLSPTEWAGHTLVTGMMSIVGNVMEKGPDSRADLPFSYYAGGPVKVYWDDNTVVGAAVQSNRILLGDPTIVNQPPVWPDVIEVLPSIDVKGHLLKNAGARPWDRDEVDIRIIREIKEGKNNIIDSEKEVNGYPTDQPTYRKFDPSVWGLLK